jgi:hypothetical protein
MPNNQPSEAQLAANRANAQFSTGPSTAEGLAISSRNHTIHGLTADPTETLQLLPGESKEAYEAFLADFEADWKPATATERDIVTRMASHSWLRSRAIRLQNQLILKCGGYELGPEERKNFELFNRYHNMHSRGFSKALSEIMRLRNFQSKQAKDTAIVERRNLDIQIRFESQKRAAELHAAKLETARLKQEAIKQRNNRAPKPQPAAQDTEMAQTQTS